MATKMEPMGNPGLRPDGSVVNATSLAPATPATAALVANRRPMTAGELEDRLPWELEDRLPWTVKPRDQAAATGGGPPAPEEERAATAQLPLAKSSAALVNASGPRRTG